MKSFVGGLLLLLASVSLAWADPPLTRRSSQMQHDGLKQYYEVAAPSPSGPSPTVGLNK
jgi:hypothetical protein